MAGKHSTATGHPRPPQPDLGVSGLAWPSPIESVRVAAARLSRRAAAARGLSQTRHSLAAVAIRWLTAFLDFRAAAFEPGSSFWQAVSACTLSAPRGASAEFVTLVPERGDSFLRVQRIDHGSAGCHLDLHVEQVSATVERAVRLGASVLREKPGGAVLSSPAGLAFCVVRHPGEEERPPPLLWPGGQRSLVDQLCIDIPPGAFGGECAFWTAVTGWERRASDRSPEFEFLVRPAGMPLRLLLQRVDDEEADRCRAHLDLACDNVAAERDRHEALGAVMVRTMPNWTTLQDPAGVSYCITRRDPDTGKL
jgi:Glyoxalase-like domain